VGLYAARLRDLIEQQPQLRSRLAKEATEQGFEPNGEQGQVQFTCQRGRRHGLARAWRSDQQHVSGRGLSMVAQPRSFLLLAHNAA
jgi:hypothetical protein